MNTLNRTFHPQTLTDGLLEVRRIDAEFFANLKVSDFDKPVKGSPKERNLCGCTFRLRSAIV